MNSSPKSSAPHPGNMAEQVYEQIVEEIAQRRINEKQIFSYRQIADRLEFSLQPVTIALKRLEYEGIVESTPRVGTQLRSIDADEVWGMLQWRVAIEVQSARLASEMASKSDKKGLVEMGEKLDSLEGKKTYNDSDVHFHGHIAQLSGCQAMVNELDKLRLFKLKLEISEVIEVTREFSAKQPPSHESLARSIARGRPDAAEHSMREHLEKSRSMYGFSQWYRQRRIPS